ncbi:MAG: hypothetical protein WBA53_17935 [Burkholderiaceae bacterium]
MRAVRLSLMVLGLVAATASVSAPKAPVLLKFHGAIGVDPLTAAGGVDTLNVVRGVNPGGRAWVMRDLKASVRTDGNITVQGFGLLFASGDLIATRGPVTHVSATLACGPADASAIKFASPGAPLDTNGNFRIDGVLTLGANAAVLPPVCENPALLIRAFNPTTFTQGGWFAVGIPDDSE